MICPPQINKDMITIVVQAQNLEEHYSANVISNFKQPKAQTSNQTIGSPNWFLIGQIGTQTIAIEKGQKKTAYCLIEQWESSHEIISSMTSRILSSGSPSRIE